MTPEIPAAERRRLRRPEARPAVVDRALPVVPRLCPSCGTYLAKALADLGMDYHVDCAPSDAYVRRPITAVGLLRISESTDETMITGGLDPTLPVIDL